MSNSLWTHGMYVAHQAPLSVGILQATYWSEWVAMPSSWMCNVKLFVGWFVIYSHFTDVKLGFWNIRTHRRLLMTSDLAIYAYHLLIIYRSTYMYVYVYLSTCLLSLIYLSITYLSPISLSSHRYSRSYGNRAPANLFTRLLKPTGSFSFLGDLFKYFLLIHRFQMLFYPIIKILDKFIAKQAEKKWKENTWVKKKA